MKAAVFHKPKDIRVEDVPSPRFGVYGTDARDFPLGQLFDKGIRLSAGQCQPHVYIDRLLELASQGKMTADRLFNDKTDGCVKIVLKP